VKNWFACLFIRAIEACLCLWIKSHQSFHSTTNEKHRRQDQTN
jgi:hypothetical protein